jgi:hypothetical protein
MNDMAFLCEHAADRAGVLANADIGEINQRLRRNILSARGYQQPIGLTTRRAEIEEAADRFANSICVNGSRNLATRS